jgi:Na+-translocating ferredoxin:NAD+ oxidoreductase RNF subunit RnfB
MSRAIEKLSRIDALTKGLPGRDCGACGCPSCAALAEDIVLDRGRRELCVFLDAETKEEPS